MIAIGIDIGGTSTKFCAADKNGKILKKDIVPTRSAATAEDFLNLLASVVAAWRADFKGSKIILGVGAPGDTDHQKGVLRWAPNIPWQNLQLALKLKEKTGCDCFVSNDANMAAWGVYAKELKAEYKNLIIVTMGTGIGGGIITGGRLYNGSTGSAGELGHIKVDYSPKAALCGCGARGCLEAYCGAAGITRAALKAVKKHPGSVLSVLMKKEPLTAKLLSAAAKKGDKAALEIWRETGLYLGRGLAAFSLLLNPEAIVLAGGVSRGAQFFKPAIKEVFAEQTVKMPFRKIKLLLSSESDIGALGAALYALEKVNEK